jgi:hypothetical protein
MKKALTANPNWAQTRAPALGLNQMFIQLSKKYLRRSMEFERKIMSRVTARFRSQRVITPHGLDGVGALRDRLKEASRRVAQSQRMVDGWRDLIDPMQAERHDVTAARSLLETFQASLEAAISDKKEAEKALAREGWVMFFEGVSRRADAFWASSGVSPLRRKIINAGPVGFGLGREHAGMT